MQPIGTVGVVPQLVNQAVMMVPAKNSVDNSRKGGGGCCGRSRSKKGSCGSCGKCIGSLFVMLFAFICASCCYAYPIYNAFMNPEYFKSREKPIWTWEMLFNKAKEVGNSIIQPKPSEPEGEVFSRNSQTRDLEGAQLHRLNSTSGSEPSSSFLNLENFLGKNAQNLMLPLYNSSQTSSVERKLNIRGGGQTKEELAGIRSKPTHRVYFSKEYCERGEDGMSTGAWKELCNFKHNVTNLECIDMMNGPAICVGIRNHQYEIFSVSKLCKSVDPEIPVEVFPAISDICYSENSPNGLPTSAAVNNTTCPCMVTSSSIDNTGLSGNATTVNPDTNDFITLDKLNSDVHELLRV